MWDLPIYMGLVGSVAYSAETCDGILPASVSAAVRAVKENDKRLI